MLIFRGSVWGRRMGVGGQTLETLYFGRGGSELPCGGLGTDIWDVNIGGGSRTDIGGVGV